MLIGRVILSSNFKLSIKVKIRDIINPKNKLKFNIKENRDKTAKKLILPINVLFLL